MNKYIRQEDGMGCSVACVAYVLGISYAEAVELFDNKERRHDRGYTTKAIRIALERGGLKYRSHYVGRNNNPFIPEGSIVYVPKCKTYTLGHYMVKIKGGYMDPFINLHESIDNHILSRAGLRTDMNERISLVLEKI